MKTKTSSVAVRWNELFWLYGLFLLAALSSLSPLRAQTSYTWKNVTVSGAGAMVTGVWVHPLQSNLVYIRTDVGGSYRWNPSAAKWIPLNDASFPFNQISYYCCESLAIDPGNVNVLYYAGGVKTSAGNGAIFKSTNQGATWTQLSLAVPMGGNMDRRWAGERLAVHPFNSNVVLFGSRTKGLWRSTDAGGSWTQVSTTSIPIAADNYGVQAVAFDPTTSGRVYVAVSGLGVYKSTDSGVTWTSIGGPTAPMRMKVASNSVVWLTTRTGVSKFTGTWTDYTVGGSAAVCVALGVNPSNANDILVRRSEFSPYTIYRTLNGGSTWTLVPATLSSTVTWVPTPPRFGPADFAFDPSNPNIVWGNQWRTDNINATTVSWVMRENGHEEDVAGALIAPPSGFEVLTGVFDDDGFALNNGLDSYPTKQLGITSSWNGHTWGMDYQETNPQNMMRIGSQSFYGGVIAVATSTNGGSSWLRTTFPTNLFPLACAMSANNNNNMVVICNANYSTSASTWTPVAATNQWRYTSNGGASWSVSSGLPTPPTPYGPWGANQFLAADRVNGTKFYYLDINSTNNYSTGKIYGSANGGASFSWLNTGANQLLPAKRWFILKAQPGTESAVWACVDNYPSSTRTSDEGLYRSQNGGAQWTKVLSVTRAFSFGFGKPPTGGSTPALYLYGRITGATADSIYRSLDLGTTWLNIQSLDNNLSDYPSFVEGSRQTFGRVFVGTGGRGFFYGSDYAGTPYGGTPAAIPGTVQIENYDLGGEGVAYHDTTVNNNGGQYRTSEGVDLETCTDSGGGYDLSYTATGEWIKYTVSVATARTYTVSFRVASANTGASFHLEDASGTNLTGSVAVPNTGGWQIWTNVTKSVTLPAGQQVLKLVEETAGFNLNSMTFN